MSELEVSGGEVKGEEKIKKIRNETFKKFKMIKNNIKNNLQ